MSNKKQVDDNKGAFREKLTWILVYSCSSSTMLVMNKFAVDSLPLPTVITGIQLSVSALFVILMQCGGLPVLGPIEKSRILPFVLFTAIFAGGLFANIKALQFTTVGTVIAARCCLPAAVCIIEWAFMGRALPSLRSVVSLCGVIGFAGIYVWNERSLDVYGAPGYTWLLVWWSLLALSMTVGKWLTEKVEMNQWERVFYNNAFAVPPTMLLFIFTGENKQILHIKLGRSPWLWLTMSCLNGICISYSGWRLRSIVTATTFTLVGVLNKMTTIAITIVAWPGSASITSVVSLGLCILSGLFYQGAQKRLPL